MLEKQILPKNKRKNSQLEFISDLDKNKNKKKSRFWLAITIASSIGLGLLFSLIAIARETKLRPLPSLPKFFSHQGLVEEGEFKRGLSNEEMIEELNKLISSNFKDKKGNWGIYIYDFRNDFSVGLNDDSQFAAASLIKLPVVFAFYQQVEAGNFELGEEYVLKASDKRSGAGILFDKPAGTKVTLGEIARLALSNSDNTAFNVLKIKLGEEKIDEAIELLWMKQTSLAKNLTSPKDIGLFFKQLYRGELLKQESRELMIESLTKTAFEDRISLGISEEVRVSHKVGNETRVFSDAGIVFLPNRPFVLAILNDDIDLEEAKKAIPNFTRQVYQLFQTDSSY